MLQRDLIIVKLFHLKTETNCYIHIYCTDRTTKTKYLRDNVIVPIKMQAEKLDKGKYHQVHELYNVRNTIQIKTFSELHKVLVVR